MRSLNSSSLIVPMRVSFVKCLYYLLAEESLKRDWLAAELPRFEALDH